MQDGKNKIYLTTLVVFWLIFAFFVLSVLSMYAMPLLGQINQYIFIPLMVVLPILGIALVVLVSRLKHRKTCKSILYSYRFISNWHNCFCSTSQSFICSFDKILW